MKKLIAMLVAVTMLATIAGCGKKQSPDNSSDSSNPSTAVKTEKLDLEKKIDLSVFMWGPKDVLEGDKVVEELNKKFNVSLKIQRILAKEYRQNLEMKIAANDMPDIFRYQSTTAQIYTTLQQDGYLANFTEYAKKYDFKNITEVVKDTKAAGFGEKNGFYQLPTNKGGSDTGIVVRKDWLDKLNMKAPQTYDEYYTMLKAFKDNKLGGDETVPHTGFDTDNFATITSYFLGGFTGGNEWKKVNGSLQNVRVAPEFKEGLKYLKKLYGEGLLDKEYFTLNESQATGKVVSGKSGAIIIWVSNRYETLLKSLKEKDPKAELEIITPNLKGPAGNTYLTPTGYSDPVVITKKGRAEENISRAMAVIDYLRGKEGIELTQNGLEGIHYKVESGKKVYNDVYNKEFISGIGHMLAMFTDYTSARDKLSGPISNYFKVNQKYAIYNPVEGFTNEAFQEATVSMNSIYSQWVIGFMTGKYDVDKNWDEYVSAMKKSGIDTMTKEASNYAKEKGIN